MKQLFSLAIVAGLGTGLGRHSFAQAIAPAVTNVISRYDAAWNRHDTATVARLLAPDYVYFTSTGRLTRRAESLAFLSSPTYIIAAAQRSEIEVLHASADLALVSSRWTGHGSSDGKPFNDDQRCGLVLRKAAGGWQILSEHCTQIAKD
jgi:ketosteroid isomerase-like protein